MNATTNTEDHREAGAAGRGDPAGLLRHPAPRHDGSGYSLWLWVAGAFLVSLLAWAVLFKAAQHARVQPVPLAPKGARP